jgi:hypothetical protein
MNERIDMVQIQRDELKMVLGELYDKLRHGVFNGMFPERPEKDPKKKCKKGKTIREVQWCLGSCCEGCEPVGECHLSLEEYDIFGAMSMARAVLKKQPAEMPVVRPEDFPHYSDGVVYNPSARWIARQFYRFAVGYWLFANHSDKEQEKDWERAYNDILSISLRDKGPVFRKMVEAVYKITDPEKIKKYLEENKDVDDLMEEAAKSIHEKVEGEKDVDKLVLQALTLRMDYQFGHEYPGGDIDVYDGVFCGLIDSCLKIAGIEPKDRPNSYDFDDDDEYRRKLLAWEHEHKSKIYAFMLETGGM